MNAMDKEIKRNRSAFWFKVFENDSSYTIAANDLTKWLIDSKYPHMKDSAPKGWSKRNTWSLWFPASSIDSYEIEKLLCWGKEVCDNNLWLSHNRNLVNFDGDELNCCVASDWNFDLDAKKRTEVGEAEYKLKYHGSTLSDEDAKKYKQVLISAISKSFQHLPILKYSTIITTIPYVASSQNKLAWAIARSIAENNQLPFLTATLTTVKPQMKELPVEEKIRTWKELYSNNCINLSDKVNFKMVVIVDDLYQSGASMWAYAEYLKSLGASKVLGLVAVKSMRDSDNK